MARSINAATKRLEEWQKIFEMHGLKVNLDKTNYAESNFFEKTLKQLKLVVFRVLFVARVLNETPLDATNVKIRHISGAVTSKK